MRRKKDAKKNTKKYKKKTLFQLVKKDMSENVSSIVYLLRLVCQSVILNLFFALEFVFTLGI